MSPQNESNAIQATIDLYRTPEAYVKKANSRYARFFMLSVLMQIYPILAALFDIGPRWSIAVTALVAGILSSTSSRLRLEIGHHIPLLLKYTVLKEDAVAEFERRGK